MSIRAPNMIDVLRRVVERSLADLRVSMPATVQSYDATNQLVSVRPDLKDTTEGEDGAEIVKSLPVISNVPVQFPGGNGFACTFPLVPGDTVLLVFSDRSLDRWIEQGGEVDPGFLHMHNLTDAVAIPGVRNLKNKLTNAPTDRARFGKDGGAGVECTALDVIVNGGGAAVGRVGDSVSVTIPIATVAVIDPTFGAIPNPAPIVVTGTITAGAPHFKG